MCVCVCARAHAPLCLRGGAVSAHVFGCLIPLRSSTMVAGSLPPTTLWLLGRLPSGDAEVGIEGRTPIWQ